MQIIIHIKQRTIRKTIGLSLFLLLGTLWFGSCKEGNDFAEENKVLLKVAVSGSEFNGDLELKTTKASTEVNSEALAKQIRYVPFDADHVLAVELTVDDTDIQEGGRMMAKNGSRAAVEDVQAGIRYKIVVYSDNGEYITERDYIRGQESQTEDLMLDSGVEYTFIAYSINSTSDNPAVSFADPANKNLSNSSIQDLEGKSDLMYFRKEMQLSSSGENYLGIVFQHKFSQITTVLDATASGYTISNINASFDSHYPQADINLSDAAITREGTLGSAAVNFSGINTAVVTGINILNANTTSAALNIASITIGTITRTDIPPIGNLNVTPGMKYNLNLTITPNDVNTEHMGVPVVKVAGMLWMRHNLGANTSLDPDQSPTTANHMGNYYQYGRRAVVATSSTGSGAISGWNTTAAPAGAWNSGTEAAPVKTNNDPCPSGFRVPTRMEYQTLIDNTVASNIGTWTTNGNENRTGAAKVLTSKTNANVKLTFPAAGYRNGNQGILYWRGGNAGYWTSSVTASELIRYRIGQNVQGIATDDAGQPNNLSRTSGFFIRCIAQ